MKAAHPIILLTTIILGIPSLPAGTSGEGEATIEPEEIVPFSLADFGLVSADAPAFLRDTRFLLSGRLRYEFGDDTLREDSNALTWRNRLGIETGDFAGVSLLAELEHTWSPLGEDGYNPFPRAGRTVIADPENFELNRLQLRYEPGFYGSILTVGRQELALGDQRFIGTVGWRQNEQTLDAARLQLRPREDLVLDYAYVWRVNRIFGEEAPLPALNHFDSDSHLLNLRYEGFAFGKVEAFGYLLDFDESPVLSSQTFGVRVSRRSAAADSTNFFYDAQAAVQTDYGNNPLDYTAPYYHLEFGADLPAGPELGLGYEVLGEDNGAAFQTPLGTNHKFNGFADAFLTTPGSGLRDAYLWCGLALPAEVKSRLTLHHFRTDDGNDSLGNEVDLTLERKLGDHAAVLLKGAHLAGEGTQQDVTRASVEFSYQF